MFFLQLQNHAKYRFISTIFIVLTLAMSSSWARPSIAASIIGLNPTAIGKNVETNEDTPFSFDLSGTGKSITYIITKAPEHAQYVQSGKSITLSQLQENYNGADSLEFKVRDSRGRESKTAKVNITIHPVNDAPTLSGQDLQTTTYAPITSPLSFSDVDGDTVSISIVNSPMGKLALANNQVTYTPPYQFSGIDSFELQASDGNALSDVMSFKLNVLPVTLNTTDYLYFSLTIQDFSYPEMSIAVLTKILDLHELYQVPLDLSFTHPMISVYQTTAPELLERIKNSPWITVNYHLRPPLPYFANFDWSGVANLSTEEQKAVISNYESHGLDLQTGQPTTEAGGYQLLSDIFATAPMSVGINTDASLGPSAYSVFQSMGMVFSVIHNIVNLGDMKYGSFIRPQQNDLKIFDHVGEDSSTVIHDALTMAKAESRAVPPYFVGAKIHDNDFFAVDSAWLTVYGAKAGNGPPFDLTRKSALLSTTDQEAMWSTYQSMVIQAYEMRARGEVGLTQSKEMYQMLIP